MAALPVPVPEFKFDAWLTPPLQRIYMTKRHGKILALIVQQVGEKQFGVMALETEIPSDVKGTVAIAEKVFENHAHEIVGERKSLRGATSLAERYKASWRKRKPSKRCECKEICAKKAA